MLVGLLLAAGVAGASSAEPENGSACAFLVDGEPAERIDCRTGGTWVVRCAIPSGTRGKLRAKLWIAERQLEAAARLPLPATQQASVDIPLAGPGERAGRFLVERATGSLLPGQPLAHKHLCPAVQPGVAPGTVAEVGLGLQLAAHQRTGFAEEERQNGIIERVPVYDGGRVIGRARSTLVQLPVPEDGLLAHTAPLPSVDAVEGQLQLQREGAWRSFGWTGAKEALSGGTTVLWLDFPATEVADATGQPAGRFLEGDLAGWLTGQPGRSLLGLAAWRRSELTRPSPPPTFTTDGRWRRADAEGVTIRVGSAGDQVRVLIAHRTSPFDDEAHRAIDELAAAR